MRVAGKARATGKRECAGLLLSRPAGDSLGWPSRPDMIRPIQNRRAAGRTTCFRVCVWEAPTVALPAGDCARRVGSALGLVQRSFPFLLQRNDLRRIGFDSWPRMGHIPGGLSPACRSLAPGQSHRRCALGFMGVAIAWICGPGHLLNDQR
jgi:hypothetical protein